jgi:hypothetical protein
MWGSGKDAFNEIKMIKPELQVILMSGYSEDMLEFKT